MGSGEYTYNPDHMDEVSQLYKQSADYTEVAIGDLDKAKTCFIDNYQGQSDDMVLDLFEKIKAHMELLRDCFSQMETYVTYTKDTMVEQDERLAEGYTQNTPSRRRRRR